MGPAYGTADIQTVRSAFSSSVMLSVYSTDWTAIEAAIVLS
jgi:hypothetical protein